MSELTVINMLSSQAGSGQNLLLLWSCSSLWFTTQYSMSSLSPAYPAVQTVASKNSTEGWHNHFQMNNCMAAQCNIDVPPSVVCKALWFRPLEGKDRKRFPHQSPHCHNCQVNISYSFCRTLCFYNECRQTQVIHRTFWPSLGGKGYSHICRAKIRLLVLTSQQSASQQPWARNFNCCISLIYTLK